MKVIAKGKEWNDQDATERLRAEKWCEIARSLMEQPGFPVYLDETAELIPEKIAVLSVSIINAKTDRGFGRLVIISVESTGMRMEVLDQNNDYCNIRITKAEIEGKKITVKWKMGVDKLVEIPGYKDSPPEFVYEETPVERSKVLYWEDYQ
ncbi:hypothetical protein A3G50_02225 [Candidatus Jorgensenbacteria bacterium RIFCSPLOWO2_12_FULL_42_11]|uniref:Uncharacterized protein n=1 Tax=Candidatus Jorgensenbacteria bacterium RIFCSPLOWO2_12_FULL_42_11 TaxID=1798473 RepID=A0A1F6C0X2_9BACT|nr:MAG: hypothetical protein A3G50_02225 [Candidatus Jorgensenbacteria bacterium RIFCSPLOWO2_12_FULL_42_11]